MPPPAAEPELAIRVLGVRTLGYTTSADPDDDRPRHVRAASGLAQVGGRLVVVQDDTAFLAVVAADGVSAIALPRGPDRRRRFEVALGNKLHKLDLEACVAVGDELWAFGSGSTAVRERIVILAGDAPRVVDAAAFYAAMRAELGGTLNVEGAAVVNDELWLFHRGNTGPEDPGPAVVRFARTGLEAWLRAGASVPGVVGSQRYELGAIAGVPIGFTDAVGVAGRAFFLAAAEASPNAIDDGCVLGSQLGVIDGDRVRAAPLAHGGAPLKAEGLAIDPADPRRAWVVTDPDDIDRPAQLYELELVGPW